MDPPWSWFNSELLRVTNYVNVCLLVKELGWVTESPSLMIVAIEPKDPAPDPEHILISPLLSNQFPGAVSTEHPSEAGSGQAMM